MSKKLLIKTIALCVLAAPQAFSEVLVAWQMDDIVTGSLTAAPATVISGVSSGNLAANAGLGGTASWPDVISVLHNNAADISLAYAIANNEYFSFTVTPDANVAVSYTTLNFLTSLGANTQPAQLTYVLMSSATGFTETDGIATSNHLLNSASGTQSASYDISSVAELQGLTTPVEFRLYLYNTGANRMTRVALGRFFSTDSAHDVELLGSLAAVPEPSTAALVLGATALAGAAIRRRRIS